MRKHKFENDSNLNSLEVEFNSKRQKNSSETFDSDVKTYNINKKIVESYILHNTSQGSERKKSNHFSKENTDRFFTFEFSHKQFSFLSKGFKTIKNSDLNKKLDIFLEEEVIKNKSAFPQIDFNVEAIIDRNVQYKDNTGDEVFNSLYTSNKNNLNHQYYSSNQHETGYKENQFGPDKDYNQIPLSNNYVSNQSTSFISNFKFLIISNIYIYEMEYSIKDCLLNVVRKVNLVSVDFFSLTPDFKKLIIHINNIHDNNGNISLNYENAVQIVFCLSNILFHCYSVQKNLVVIPKSYSFYEKAKKIFFFEKMKEFYNEWAENLCLKIGNLLPLDKEEKLVKCVSLSKIESKFTEAKIDIILMITNKKIYELSSENFDLQHIDIIPFSKMRKILQYNKTHKFQIFIDEEFDKTSKEGNKFYNYSSIHSRSIVKLLKNVQSKECLLELEVVKMD